MAYHQVIPCYVTNDSTRTQNGIFPHEEYLAPCALLQTLPCCFTSVCPITLRTVLVAI